MENLSINWAEYARAQEELNNSKIYNDHHCGLEYALNKTLDDLEQGDSFDRSDVKRRIRTGARQNRYRTRLARLQPITWQPEMNDPTQSYEARLELAILQDVLGNDNYILLLKVAEGHRYSVLANEEGLTTPALRKRVSRLRSKARKLLSDG